MPRAWIERIEESTAKRKRTGHFWYRSSFAFAFKMTLVVKQVSEINAVINVDNVEPTQVATEVRGLYWQCVDHLNDRLECIVSILCRIHGKLDVIAHAVGFEHLFALIVNGGDLAPGEVICLHGLCVKVVGDSSCIHFIRLLSVDSALMAVGEH